MPCLILSIEKIVKDFEGVRALDNVDCIVQEGHIHGLIGPNGSGKSTLFNVITGVSPATGGKIVFGDRDISGLKPYVVARLGISRTFQRGFVALTMTYLENAICGAHVRTKVDTLGMFLRGLVQYRLRRRSSGLSG
jgi:ABC-type branched-subunit amino acid transport system ATPase component